MASNGVTRPLLPGVHDPNPPTRRKDAHKRRTFRQPRNEKIGIGSTPFYPSPSPNFRRVILLLSLYLGAAMICFYMMRNELKGEKTNGILDSLYFCIVTMTTVGFGDLVPNSDSSKLLACVLVFSGMALGCLILSKAADNLLEKQETLLVKALHMRRNLEKAKILKEAEANRTRYKCILVFVLIVVLMITGTIFLSAVEKLGTVDAFYCVCSTITTLGYGDKSFSTKEGRVFAVFWIPISTVCLAKFFLYIAELNAENRGRKLVNWVLTRELTNVDLALADLDGDGNVEAAEFVLYKLKEMGKVTQEDISVIMQQFENLDVDHSRTLTASDIALAQIKSNWADITSKHHQDQCHS